MTEPVMIDPGPDPFAETDDQPVLPVEIDLENPGANTLEQAVPVVLDVEGYLYS